LTITQLAHVSGVAEAHHMYGLVWLEHVTGGISTSYLWYVIFR